MAVRQISRKVVGTWLGVARVPADLATRVLPDGPTGPRVKARLAIDNIDASARTMLGTLLRDEELQADGERRSVAFHERWRALGLRGKAEAKRTDAKARAADERQAADQRVIDARKEAAQAKEAIVDGRTARKARVKKVAAEQEQAVAQVAEAKSAELDKQAKVDRLEAVEQEVVALDAEATALTAADEAERLTEAAAKTKAKRKEENAAITRP